MNNISIKQIRLFIENVSIQPTRKSDLQYNALVTHALELLKYYNNIEEGVGYIERTCRDLRSDK